MKNLLLVALCSLASCSLWAMNNAEQPELARREAQSEFAAISIDTLAISIVSTATLCYLATITDSWRNKHAGNAVWCGASVLAATVNNSAFLYKEEGIRRVAEALHRPHQLLDVFGYYSLFANPIMFNAAKEYLSYQQNKRGAFSRALYLIGGTTLTFFGGLGGLRLTMPFIR